MPAAALVALACVALAWHRSLKLERLTPPGAAALLTELEVDNPPHAGDRAAEEQRRAMIAELNQRIADVSFELSLVPAVYTALTRVCLASGTALTLLGFLDWAQAPVHGGARAVVCAMSGLVGAGAVSAIGRGAKRTTQRIRESWDRSSRELGKALGTSLS
ncbi:MAG: hypothetical protein ABI488_20755 [Polyangiaceae bacterium]